MEKKAKDQLERQSNKWVSSRESRRKKCVLNTIWQRKHRWLGHVLRNDVLLRDIIEGRMEDRAYRRRKRPCWV